jgi:hypothetical protein
MTPQHELDLFGGTSFEMNAGIKKTLLSGKAAWTRDPAPWIYLIYYGLGFVGVRMAVTGDRRALLFWNVCYVVILNPAVVLSQMSI